MQVAPRRAFPACPMSGSPNVEHGAGAPDGASRLGLHGGRDDRASRRARPPDALVLLAKEILAGLALLPRCERRRRGAALLLVLVVLSLRLLLFLVASHLTFRHGVLPAGCR